jgi:hypothetical protein
MCTSSLGNLVDCQLDDRGWSTDRGVGIFVSSWRPERHFGPIIQCVSGIKWAEHETRLSPALRIDVKKAPNFTTTPVIEPQEVAQGLPYLTYGYVRRYCKESLSLNLLIWRQDEIFKLQF